MTTGCGTATIALLLTVGLTAGCSPDEPESDVCPEPLEEWCSVGTTRCPDLPSSVEELESCEYVVQCGLDHYSWTSDGLHGISRYYDSDSLELIAVHEWSDVPSFCDNTETSVWHGESMECATPCIVLAGSEYPCRIASHRTCE